MQKAYLYVAPRAGAWIETTWPLVNSPLPLVAPRAGAWIETSCPTIYTDKIRSPPVRGRGLKRSAFGVAGLHPRRPPCGGVD